ncbi:MAG: hypothetical protein ABSG72_12050 [Candidatus Sulfotelmatobacter sp.]
MFKKTSPAYAGGGGTKRPSDGRVTWQVAGGASGMSIAAVRTRVVGGGVAVD